MTPKSDDELIKSNLNCVGDAVGRDEGLDEGLDDSAYAPDMLIRARRTSLPTASNSDILFLFTSFKLISAFFLPKPII